MFTSARVQYSSGIKLTTSFVKIAQIVQMLQGEYTKTHTQTDRWSYKPTLFLKEATRLAKQRKYITNTRRLESKTRTAPK
jgi:hypothetical protein